MSSIQKRFKLKDIKTNISVICREMSVLLERIVQKKVNSSSRINTSEWGSLDRVSCEMFFVRSGFRGKPIITIKLVIDMESVDREIIKIVKPSFPYWDNSIYEDAGYEIVSLLDHNMAILFDCKNIDKLRK